jgi:hypothetical protein
LSGDKAERNREIFKRENHMKRILQISLPVLFLAMNIHAADPAMSIGMSNGRAWNGLGGGSEKLAVAMKFLYLTGLADGLHQASGDLYTELSSKPVEKVAKQVEKIIPGLLGSTTFVVMIASLDEFYSDPENLDIPITYAARYVRSQTEGRSTPQQLNESLLRTRAVVRMAKDLGK